MNCVVPAVLKTVAFVGATVNAVIEAVEIPESPLAIPVEYCGLACVEVPRL
jgi:hypothetical protein